MLWMCIFHEEGLAEQKKFAGLTMQKNSRQIFTSRMALLTKTADRKVFKFCEYLQTWNFFGPTMPLEMILSRNCQNIIKEIFSEVKLVLTEDAEGNDRLQVGPERKWTLGICHRWRQRPGIFNDIYFDIDMDGYWQLPFIIEALTVKIGLLILIEFVHLLWSWVGESLLWYWHCYQNGCWYENSF